ncbi:dTDP-glucose 4,6-dehydratase [Halalkalibacter sp. APA_J-10(15)]|uniref:dTDP-glucose 4,6-dehydratase n=1 Tax=unclassified Halalkalibacter TaxID=2893063 RepID=UPI001FF28A22|nr:dTDP-glucose 4,6-dehydratase [Halalkalibacter sp. APA_J-10(15)]MCK0472938.1 dTDP-glucose 4,6-dehydratase [Halalkalibacter sp. APA_J-10(15)]
MLYFITGGAGFIGANFIHYMFNKYKDKITIVNIDNLTYAGDEENLKNIDSVSKEGQYFFEKVDICNNEEIERLFHKYRPDYVLNFAAESHVDRSIKTPQKFLKTNILGTQVLLDASLKYGVKRYHQVSTDEVYGSLTDVSDFFTETTLLDPSSPYSASKASADLICQAYYRTYQLPITISRCSNNYGPYQHQEKLIPMIIHKIIERKRIPIYGDGLNVRDWLYVEDHCSALDIILHHGEDNQVYNIGANNEKTNIEVTLSLINQVRDILSINRSDFIDVNGDLIEFVEDRKGHDRRYAIDSTKLKNSFNWSATIDFNEGIKRTVEWYLKRLHLI